MKSPSLSFYKSIILNSDSSLVRMNLLLLITLSLFFFLCCSKSLSLAYFLASVSLLPIKRLNVTTGVGFDVPNQKTNSGFDTEICLLKLRTRTSFADTNFCLFKLPPLPNSSCNSSMSSLAPLLTLINTISSSLSQELLLSS